MAPMTHTRVHTHIHKDKRDKGDNIHTRTYAQLHEGYKFSFTEVKIQVTRLLPPRMGVEWEGVCDGNGASAHSRCQKLSRGAAPEGEVRQNYSSTEGVATLRQRRPSVQCPAPPPRQGLS